MFGYVYAAFAGSAWPVVGGGLRYQTRQTPICYVLMIWSYITVVYILVHYCVHVSMCDCPVVGWLLRGCSVTSVTCLTFTRRKTVHSRRWRQTVRQPPTTADHVTPSDPTVIPVKVSRIRRLPFCLISSLFCWLCECKQNPKLRNVFWDALLRPQVSQLEAGGWRLKAGKGFLGKGHWVRRSPNYKSIL